MSRIIVERRFPSPMSDAELFALAERRQKCLENHRVTFRGSMISQDRMRAICLYDAPDAESVRCVEREAEGMFEAVWTADVFGESEKPVQAG